MVATYIQSVAEAALRQGEFLLRDWLPGGALHGDEYDVRNPRRADDDCIGNFRINLNGPWADFADGSERARGGDWVSLYAYLRNMTQLGAAREVARQIGHEDFKGNGKDHGHNGVVSDLSGLMGKKDGGREKNGKPTWTPIVPVPDDAPPPPKAIERFRSYPAATWTYRTADGKVAQHLHRYDPPGERKQFIPLTYCESDQPGRSPAWRQKGLGDNRPLYNLNLIVSSPAAELIVCEGEKASDAAAMLAPECVATTSLNGAQSPGKTDWTPVVGRVVFVVPDHDEPGAGYAKKVADLAMKAGAAKVRIAAWPEGTPEGYDAADALASGWTVEDFAKLLAEARLVEVEQPDQRQGEKDDLDSLIHSQSDLNRTEAFTVRSALAAIGKDDRLDGSKLSAARTIGYGLADSYKSANAPLGLALTQEWDARTGGNAAEWYGQADPDFEAKGNPVTLDSVYKLARQRGWKPEDGTPALPGVRVDPDFVSLAEFIGIPSPPDWIIKGWLTGQSIAVAFGDSAAGKSFFAIDLACCVAAGIPWHGYATKLSPVLYCAGEGHTGLRRRFAAWSLANGIEVSHDEVIAQNFSINRRSFALDEGGAAAVIEEIKAMAERLGEGVRLIVIDTLATMFVGDENSTKDMNAFIQQLKVFVEKYGATILIVHHTGHGDKTRARGAYSLYQTLLKKYFM